MGAALALCPEREAGEQFDSSDFSFASCRKVNTDAPEKSFGEFPADPWAFYRCFRDKWPEFIRRNFRNSTDAAAFFGVDDRTVRGWLEGSTAPRGQVVAYAVATMPERAQHIVRAA